MESSQSTDNQEQPKPLSHILKDLSQVRKDFEAGQISDVDFAKGVNTQAVSLRSYSENLNPITEAYIQRCLLESIRLVKSKKGDFQADMATKNGLDNAIALGLDKKDGAIGAYIKSLVKERDLLLKDRNHVFGLLNFILTKSEQELLSDPDLKEFLDYNIPKIICSLAQQEMNDAIGFYLLLYPGIRQRELGLVIQALPGDLKSEFSRLYLISQKDGMGTKNTTPVNKLKEYAQWVYDLKRVKEGPQGKIFSNLPSTQQQDVEAELKNLASRLDNSSDDEAWQPGRNSPVQTGWGKELDQISKDSDNNFKVYVKKDPEEGLVRIGGKDGR